MDARGYAHGAAVAAQQVREVHGRHVMQRVEAVQEHVGLEVELGGLAPEQGDGGAQLHEGREARAAQRRPLALVDDDLLRFNLLACWCCKVFYGCNGNALRSQR